MRLLLDMNLSPAWVELLARAGHEVVHLSKVGRGDAPDHEVLAYAASQGQVLMTHDLDFGAILAATGHDRPSVLQVRSHDIDPISSGDAIVRALAQFKGELEHGALVSLDLRGGRARLLPIRPPDMG